MANDNQGSRKELIKENYELKEKVRNLQEELLSFYRKENNSLDSDIDYDKPNNGHEAISEFLRERLKTDYSFWIPKDDDTMENENAALLDSMLDYYTPKEDSDNSNKDEPFPEKFYTRKEMNEVETAYQNRICDMQKEIDHLHKRIEWITKAARDQAFYNIANRKS